MKVFFLINAVLLIFATNIHAAEKEPSLSLGALYTYSSSIYNDTDNKDKWLPFLSYDSPTFFIRGPGFGYHLNNYFSVELNYMEELVDPSDSNNEDMKLLDKRRAGMAVKGQFKLGMLNTEILQDISGKYDGYSAKVSLGFPIYFGRSIFLGAVGYNYQSEKLSQHLYSVSYDESNRTAGAIAEYTSPSTSFVNYTLRVITPITDRFSFMTIINHLRYSDEVLDSPMVEKDNKTNLTLIASYKY